MIKHLSILARREILGVDIVCWLMDRMAPRRKLSTLTSIAWRCWGRYIHSRGGAAPYAAGLRIWSVPKIKVLAGVHNTAPWWMADISCMGDLFAEQVLLSFQGLREIYDLEAGAFLLYGALGRAIQDTWDCGLQEPHTHEGLRVMLTHGAGKHAVTVLYRALNVSHKTTTLRAKMKWEEELGEVIEDDQWTRALAYVKQVSRNARLKYTQFNYLHRTYFTLHRLHAMFPEVSPKCPRCTEDDATFLHMVWQCAPLGQRWEQVMELINDLIGERLTVTQVCLLGLSKRTKVSKHYLKFADLAMILYKRQIAKAWKASTPPTLQDWLREVYKWAKVEADALMLFAKQRGGGTLVTVWDTCIKNS